MPNKLRRSPTGPVRPFQNRWLFFASAAAGRIWNCSSVKIWFNWKVLYRFQCALAIRHSKEFKDLLNSWQNGQLSGFIVQLHSLYIKFESGNKKPSSSPECLLSGFGKGLKLRCVVSLKINKNFTHTKH